ncbi:MAG: TIGR03545 family protein [Hydrogenovibrio sp.]
MNQTTQTDPNAGATQNQADNTQASHFPQSLQSKGWIRWSGLGILGLVVALVFAISYFSFTAVLKNQLETLGSKAWGAKIEIGSLHVGILPISVGLRDLQVTDPDQPMENLMVLERISASLNLYHLVVGRTVIEEVHFTGLALHQPRETSGALTNAAVSESATAVGRAADRLGLKMPTVALPDPQAILAREKLDTLEAAKRIQTQLNDIDQAWSNLQKDLPTEAQLRDYQKRFEALTQGENDAKTLLAKKDDILKLQAELESQKATLEKAQDLLLNRLPKVQQDVVALKDLPEKDYRRLMSKYSLDSSGLSNATYLLFGPQIQYWTDQGLNWYRKLEPFIARLREMQASYQADASETSAPERALGTDVAFTEYDPQPDFIVKEINGSGTLDWGDLVFHLRQVTFDHPASRLPVLFEIFGQPKGATAKQSLRIIGESNFIDPQAPLNQARISWPGYAVSNWRLSGDATLPVVMQQGVVDIDGSVSLVGVDEVNAKVDMAFQKVTLDVSETDSKEVQRYVAPLFDDVKTFTVKTQVSGDVLAPKIQARSDLDKILSGAFKKVVGQELQQLKSQFKGQINERLQQELTPINAQLKGLLGEQAQLKADADTLEKILNYDIEALAKEQAQQQVEKEAKKAVGDQLKNLLKF